MSTLWKIAAVQMDCRLADKAANQRTMLTRLHLAAGRGAGLVVFPECALTGYCYESKQDALAQAESIPGPSVAAFAEACRELGVWSVFGLLERDGDRLFNALALIGPGELAGSYRKIHLPFLGVDRFATHGDRPFQVHDLGGLKIGLIICYDGSFPESARVLTLLGADLIILPTNWPAAAIHSAKYACNTRALENHVYYAAVNRVGDEAGFHFIGMSRIVDCKGDTMTGSDSDAETILYADIDPEAARRKHAVIIPGKHEINRVGDRRPEMYGPLLRKEIASVNARVIFSLVLVAVWLGAGLYFLLLSPRRQFAIGDSRLLGWLCLLLMLWNILRVGMAWTRPKRSHERPF